MVELDGQPKKSELVGSSYSQIPDLVRRVALNSKKSGRALRELNLIIANDQNIDPMLFAVDEAQKLLLSFSSPEHIKSAASLIDSVVLTVMRKSDASMGINPKVFKVIESIRLNDDAIKRKNSTERIVGEHAGVKNIRILLPQLTNLIKPAVESGRKSVKLAMSVSDAGSEGDIQQTIRKSSERNLWQSKIEAFLKQSIGHENMDELVELLKREPVASEENLFKLKYADISLEAISEMKSPLSNKDFLKIADYVNEAISNEEDNSPLRKAALVKLFFYPIFFRGLFKKNDYANHRLFANANNWKEIFAYVFLYGQGNINHNLQSMIAKLPGGSLESILINATNPIESDPDEASTSINSEQFPLKHPIMVMALEDSMRNNPNFKDQPMYLDEIGINFLNNTLFPLFKERLKELGLEGKLAEEVSNLEEYVKDNAYEKHHLFVLTELFEKNCGKEFLEKLNKRSEEIQQITTSVWDDAIEKMHFLPMSMGINTIEFSNDSMPSILGLKDISLSTAGSPQNWKINLKYQINDTRFSILGQLDQSGKLNLKTSLQQKFPGIYTLLNHIAVLTFHDLVVQETTKKTEINSNETTNETNGNQSDENDKSRHESLPRMQKDVRLIGDVYKETNRKPRVVELHTMILPGAKEYKSAVDLFNEAIDRNVSNDELSWITQELKNAKKKAHKISQEKKGSIPARFVLDKIVDPITGEDNFLETWVIEHTSPKPTAEELKSPVKLFERYYRGSSALASLDQMKPWFVGQ